MCHDLHVLLHALFPLLECIPDVWHEQRPTEDTDPGFLTSRLDLFLLQHTASFIITLYATLVSVLCEHGRDSKGLGVGCGKGNPPKKFLVPMNNLFLY